MGILGRLMGTAENTARGGRATGRPVRATGKTNTRNVGGRMTRGLRRSQPAPPPPNRPRPVEEPPPPTLSAAAIGRRGHAVAATEGPRTVDGVTIPVRAGAARPVSRPGDPDPLAPLLDLPAVREAAETARAAVDRLLRHKVLRRESAGVSTESALRGARASAALEGPDVALTDLRSGAVDDPVVQGALRVSAALGGMVETWPRAPGQVLARLHVLAAADLVDAAALGRPAPHAGPRLSGLLSLVTGGTAAPAVVVAALVRTRRYCG